MKRPTVSLCMIVKNEEVYLEKCLQSVKDAVDEIIIVDTGSNDRTLHIAEIHGAKTFHFQWTNDFSEARNFSIQQATMNYILVMDADEWLDEGTDLKEVLKTEKDYYMVRIKNETTSGVAILHSAIRLFKNNVGLEYFGKIHEHLNIEDQSLDLSYENGDVLLNHIGYKKDIYADKEKHKRNFQILLEEVNNNPSGYNYFNLGNQYKVNNQHREAVEAYKKSFPLSKDRVFINQLLYNMIDCLRILGEKEEALEVVNASIESFPHYTDFYFIRGRIYGEMSYFKDAENNYKKCIELGEVKYGQTLDGVGSFLAFNCLGDIYLELGDNLKAFDMAVEALKVNKYYMPALRLCYESLIRTRIPMHKINETLNSIFPLNNPADFKHLIIVLIVVKSPLLQTYLTKYKIKVSNSVRGIMELYSKNYLDSFHIWKNINLESEEHKDIILLSYIIENTNLLDKCHNSVNLNSKEWKIIDSLIHRKNVQLKKVSTELEEIILFIAEQLIYLGEDENFNFLLNLIANGSSSLKLKLSRMLLKNGFIKNAQEILLAFYNENNTNREYVELLADTCYKNNQFIEALSFYNRAVELKKEYLTYEKMYRTYEKLNDSMGLQVIKSEIKELFPKASW